MRLGILISAAAIMVASAQAASSDALAFDIGRCAAVPDAKERLACFDGIAAQLKSGVALPPAVAGSPSVSEVPAAPAAVAPAPQAAQAAPPPQKNSGSWYDPTQWFGKDDQLPASNNPADFGAEAVRQPANPAAPQPLQEITAHVTSANMNAFGRFTVVLDNGQIWRQLDSDTGTARFGKTGGDTVTISRGMLGSYNLVVDGRAKLYKVKRVQ